jgi:hypothetical protein
MNDYPSLQTCHEARDRVVYGKGIESADPKVTFTVEMAYCTEIK